MKRLTLILSGIIFLTNSYVMAQTPEFDGKNAYDYLIRQCDFGPRVPGSTAHKKCATFLKKELTGFAESVDVQQFDYIVPLTSQKSTGFNIIAHFNSNAKRKVLLCAHWDCRPYADMDPDLKNHTKPVMGANDGASGVAVLLEVARLLKVHQPAYAVDIVFFDAEDAGLYSEMDTWALGSKEYANQLSTLQMPDFGILLDMIGDANLEIPQEMYSLHYAADLVWHVWNVGQELGCSAFLPESRYAVDDDHLSLLRVGVPCVDLIDFEYPAWHTTQDTPDKCSAESLEKVGKVVMEVIYRGEF
ncbi:M28 family peptidase [bacterium]|nr:M28 family peptidase [bacterium]